MNTSKLLSSLFLVTAIAAAGCEKSTDLGHMQEETVSLVKLHATEIEVLQRRADALMQRGRTLGGDAPGIADAGRLLSEARAGLDQLRAQVTSVLEPAAASVSPLSKAVKSGDVEEVQRASDELLEKLESTEVAVKANLSAVDSWLMNAENRTMTTPAPPVAPPPPVDETPVPAPTAPAAGTGSGSAAAAQPAHQ